MRLLGTKPWSDDEMLSFLLFDIKRTHNVSREAHGSYSRLFKTLKNNLGGDVKPLSLPTTLKRLMSITGITHKSFDCCINLCMAFTEQSNATQCTHCEEPRYTSNGGTHYFKPSIYITNYLCARIGKPRKQFNYIPLIHRLRQQYANPYRARSLTEYVLSLGKLGGSQRRDIWDGSLMTDLREKKGLMKEPTDLAFQFSTDGVRVFKTRSLFSIWPLILINYNLSPKDRSKQENIIVLGIIPGPNGPKDLDPFLRPLVDEFKILQSENGVPKVWNAATEKFFNLRAHIITICGDTPARDKLLGSSGRPCLSLIIYTHLNNSNNIVNRSGFVCLLPMVQIMGRI